MSDWYHITRATHSVHSASLAGSWDDEVEPGGLVRRQDDVGPGRRPW